MDETLVTCAVDLGGRPFWVWNAAMPTAKIGTFDSELVADFWQAVSTQGRMNLHVLLHYGRNSHHISEAIFKGLARTLRDGRARSTRGARECRRPRGRSERDPKDRPSGAACPMTKPAKHPSAAWLVNARPDRRRLRPAGPGDLDQPRPDPRCVRADSSTSGCSGWRSRST